jgi:hypothetical protein
MIVKNITNLDPYFFVVKRGCTLKASKYSKDFTSEHFRNFCQQLFGLSNYLLNYSYLLSYFFG